MSLYAQGFDAIQYLNPATDLLSLPLWKWCAIVEHWAFAHTDPEEWPTLERGLTDAVNFTWIGTTKTGSDLLSDPVRWQTNKRGESLLSVHKRKRPKGGE